MCTHNPSPPHKFPDIHTNTCMHAHTHAHSSSVHVHPRIHAYVHTPTLLHLPWSSRSSGLFLRLPRSPSLAFKVLASHFLPQISVSQGFRASYKCNDRLSVTAIMIIIYTYSSLLPMSAPALTVAKESTEQSTSPFPPVALPLHGRHHGSLVLHDNTS